MIDNLEDPIFKIPLEKELALMKYTHLEHHIQYVFSIGLMYYVYPKRRDKVYYYAFLFSFFCLLNYLPQGLESLFTKFSVGTIFAQIYVVDLYLYQ